MILNAYDIGDTPCFGDLRAGHIAEAQMLDQALTLFGPERRAAVFSAAGKVDG